MWFSVSGGGGPVSSEWVDGYKVVRKQKSRYISFGLSGKGCKVYAIGHVTRRTRGNGALAVFSSRRLADNFLISQGHSDIFGKAFVKPCRYVPSADRGLWFVTFLGNRIRAVGMLPDGTRFADAVELIEEVVEGEDIDDQTDRERALENHFDPREHYTEM